MEENEKQKYEARANELRAELKQFENDWANKNGGAKPGREVIKKNPIIAQKYKKYNEIRDILSGKRLPHPKDEQHRKRKSDTQTAPSQTPSKRVKAAATPSKPQQHVDVFDGFETPYIRRLFSPVVPTSIGPTPQRDGRVLGLFDLLDDKPENTPSRERYDAAGRPGHTTQATPSKRTHCEMDQESAAKLGRTPMSTSKRVMLDTFMTPLKNRDGNAQGVKSPSTISKLQFSTPAFLRRAPLPPVDENGQYKSPAPLRLPRKPLVRGLSSVVASLRKLEEEKLDDDLEALREMEDEGGSAQPTKKSVPNENALVPDSQGPQLLGGFDDEGRFDSEPEEQLGRDGQPLQIYKKKGQKRTTRKVNMRPTRAKRPQGSLEEPPARDDEYGDDTVLETQADSARNRDAEELLDVETDSDFGPIEEIERPKKKVKTQARKEEEKENPIKRAAKKVNEMAHANFKRLKLRNSGAKGGAGFGSKFRRRR